ncbi:hypothetical protein Mapa_012287 [Marchantia paleacea]|nr:hypothetical protein Mapa_012287 [Marchantia paleacea]
MYSQRSFSTARLSKGRAESAVVHKSISRCETAKFPDTSTMTLDQGSKRRECG